MIPEILAPAGDMERLKWAFYYGADAVYIGGMEYSLRANSTNFTTEEIKEAVKYAHNINKKVYVTVNMILRNDDLKGLDRYLKKIDKIGVDAIIVSDLAVIEAHNRLKLNVPIHISTQTSTTNKYEMKLWEKLGVKRVVLARECSKEDIIDIKNNSKLELEVFIHGSMCVSYSGKCILSNYITKRDANRGGCSQSCRFDYEIKKNKKTFNMAPKDLNMIEYIKDLKKLGITSLKIEGRMRSIYYIATVVNAYKKALILLENNLLTDKDILYFKKILNKVSNRENTPQFFNKTPTEKEQYFMGRKENTNKDFLGIILDYDNETKIATIEQRNYFSVGDKLEVFSPNKKPYVFLVDKIMTKNNSYVSAARHPKEILKIRINHPVTKHDILKVPTNSRKI